MKISYCVLVKKSITWNNKLEIICTKIIPIDIANLMLKPNVSIKDKKFIIEYGVLVGQILYFIEMPTVDG